MRNLLLSLVLLLPASMAWSATQEMQQGANAPVPTVSMVYVVLFGVGFIALVVGFLAFIWWNDKRSKKTKE